MNYNLPKNWANSKVGNVINIIPISNIKLKQRDYLETGKLPVVDQGQKLVGGYTNNETLKVPCKLPVIVFGDHTKIIKYINFEFAAGADGIKILKPIEVFDPQLFFFFLNATPLPDKGYARHFQFLEKSEIPLPPQPEQKRIVGKIEELFADLDAGVEALKNSKALIKKYRQSIQNAACTGQITTAWRKRKSIPDWDYCKFNDLDISTQTGPFGTALHKKDYVENGIPIVNPTHIIDGKIVPNSAQCISREKAKELASYKLKPLDIVIGRRGEMGRAAVVKQEGLLCGTGSIFIRLKTPKLLPDFVCLILRSPAVITYLQNASRGTTMANLNQRIISDIDFPIVSPEEQRAIIDEIEDRFSIADAAEKIVDAGLKQAEHLRQSILKKAFEGRLVPQDPNDEPAQKLLDRIQAGKTKLEAGKFKASKKIIRK